MATEEAEPRSTGTWLRHHLSRIVVPILLAIVSAFVPMVASLAVADATGAEHGPDARLGPWTFPTTPARLWLTVVLVVAAVVLLVIQMRLNQARGAFYYLRLLPAGLPDWHMGRAARERCLAFRTVCRRYDPTMAPDPREIDISEDVRDMTYDLEHLVNDGATTAGHQVVPNLIAPAGLALGFDWAARHRIDLLEFNKHSKPEFALQLGTCVGDRAQYSPDPELLFRVETLEPVPDDPAAVRSVWLAIRATEKGVPGPLKDVDKKCPLRAGCDVVRVAAPITGDQAVQTIVPKRQRALLRRGWQRARQFDGAAAEISAAQLVNFATAAIRSALNDYPNATILLSLKLPKTVTVALGWRLALAASSSPPAKGCPPPCFTNPWPRLVTVAWRDDIQRNQITRVRRDQVVAESLFERGLLGAYADSWGPGASAASTPPTFSSTPTVSAVAGSGPASAPDPERN